MYFKVFINKSWGKRSAGGRRRFIQRFLKSIVEVILYAQPMIVRVAKNIYAFVADVVVLIASLPICICLKKVITKLTNEM